VRFVLPLVILIILALSLIEEVKSGLYGLKMSTGKLPLAPIVFVLWFLIVFVGGYLVAINGKQEER